jgi:hypothetical protein
MGPGAVRAIVVALLLPSVASARPDGAAAATELPFELYQQHLIVVRGAVGGLDGLRLVIDTGTIPSIVDGRVAKKLRLDAGPSRVVAFGQEVQTRAAALDGFTFGPVQSGRVSVMVGDLSYLDQVRLDAVVGLDVLARSSFAIDYARKTMSFGVTPHGTEVPMELAWPFATVRLTIGGQQVRLMVDTGSSDLVIFKSRMPSTVSDASWKGEKFINSPSGKVTLRRMELRNAALGSQTWDRLTAWSLDRPVDAYPPEVDGVLGVTALGCRQAQFDFDRGAFGCFR